jgi:hypothetical protein
MLIILKKLRNFYIFGGNNLKNRFMKKITLSIFCALGLASATTAQVNNIHAAPANTALNGFSTARGPNGTTGHTVMRAQYLVPASEMTAISGATSINSFGFNLSAGAAGGTPATGNFTVWLANTSSTSYTMGTTYNPSGSGLTMAYTGVYSIPSVATATTVDMTFTANFNYTGGGLYVAYEYEGLTFATNSATYNCVSMATTQGATGASASTTPPATLGNATFRPQFRFGVPNPNSNDVVVDYILPTGLIPANTYSMHGIQAMIRNASNTTLTSIPVNYTCVGVNSSTSTFTIPALSPGQSTVVAFPTNTVVTSGLNTYTVSVPSDQVNTNNMATATASMNCDKWAAGPNVTNFAATAVGFNTGSGIIYTKFQVPVTTTLTGARMAISSGTSNTGNNTWAVLANAAGVGIANSNTFVIAPGMLGTYVSNYTFTPQTLNPNVDYYLGIAQPSNAVGYFPIASSTVTILPPNTYFTAALTATSVSVLQQNLGFLGIQAIFAGACGPVGVNEVVGFENNLVVYPNPAVSGKATIKGLEGSNKIEVYNMLGQVVTTSVSDREEVSINLENQPAGNYLVRVTNSNNLTKTLKLINQ